MVSNTSEVSVLVTLYHTNDPNPVSTIAEISSLPDSRSYILSSKTGGKDSRMIYFNYDI